MTLNSTNSLKWLGSTIVAQFIQTIQATPRAPSHDTKSIVHITSNTIKPASAHRVVAHGGSFNLYEAAVAV